LDALSGDRDGGEDAADEGGGVAGLAVAGVAEDEAVGEDGFGDGLDVVRVDGFGIFEPCGGLGGAHDGDAGASGECAAAAIGFASGVADGGDVAADAVVDGDGEAELLAGGNFVDVEDGGFVGLGDAFTCVELEEFGLSFLVREVHGDREEEAVELGFREGEGACIVEIVLGGDDHERGEERAGDTVDGDLLFAHAFEEGALDARAGAVDFVGEDDVREDGAGDELEFSGTLVEDGVAGDVAGEEVRGELDALEGSVDTACEGGGDGGFADAWGSLDEDVAAGEDGDDEVPCGVV